VSTPKKAFEGWQSHRVNFSSFNHLAKSLSLGAARVFALGLTQRLARRRRKKKSATFEFLLINIARLVSFHSSASITTFVKAKALVYAGSRKKNDIFVVEFSFFTPSPPSSEKKTLSPPACY
jgi:hypothetical protein